MCFVLGFVVAAPRRSPPRWAVHYRTGSAAGAAPAHRLTCERWSRRARVEADYRPSWPSAHSRSYSDAGFVPASAAGAARSRRTYLFSSFSDGCGTGVTWPARRYRSGQRSQRLDELDYSCSYPSRRPMGACRITTLRLACSWSRKNYWQ